MLLRAPRQRRAPRRHQCLSARVRCQARGSLERASRPHRGRALPRRPPPGDGSARDFSGGCGGHPPRLDRVRVGASGRMAARLRDATGVHHTVERAGRARRAPGMCLAYRSRGDGSVPGRSIPKGRGRAR